MSKSLFVRRRARISSFVHRFIKRTDGIAAVEFALIVPIMATMFIGSVEMSQAITANRRVTMVASTIGDLAARNDANVTDAQILDMMNVGTYLLEPFKAYNASWPANVLKVTLSVVGSSATDATKTKLEWQCSYNASNTISVSCTCPQTNIVIPAGLVTTSDYVVIATATYGYKPPVFDVFMKTGYGNEVGGVYSFVDTVYAKPRAIVPALTIGAGAPCAMPAF